jgi:hypothetical protein
VKNCPEIAFFCHPKLQLNMTSTCALTTPPPT